MKPIAVLLPAVLLCTGPAMAQVGYTPSTLEALVASHPLVVRAVISDVKEEPPRDQRMSVTLRLEVRETLKGDRSKSLTLVHDTIVGDREWEGWRRARRELLCFLSKNEEFGKAAGLERRYPWRLGTIVRLGPSVPEERGFVPYPPPILTMDLTAVSERAQILKVARRAAREERERGTPSNYWMEIPRVLAERTGRSGDANRLAVPLDGRLKRLARELVRSPEQFLPRADELSELPEQERAWRARGIAYDAELLRREGHKALRALSEKRSGS